MSSSNATLAYMTTEQLLQLMKDANAVVNARLAAVGGTSNGASAPLAEQPIFIQRQQQQQQPQPQQQQPQRNSIWSDAPIQLRIPAPSTHPLPPAGARPQRFNKNLSSVLHIFSLPEFDLNDENAHVAERERLIELINSSGVRSLSVYINARDRKAVITMKSARDASVVKKTLSATYPNIMYAVPRQPRQQPAETATTPTDDTDAE